MRGRGTLHGSQKFQPTTCAGELRRLDGSNKCSAACFIRVRRVSEIGKPILVFYLELSILWSYKRAFLVNRLGAMQGSPVTLSGQRTSIGTTLIGARPVRTVDTKRLGNFLADAKICHHFATFTYSRPILTVRTPDSRLQQSNAKNFRQNSRNAPYPCLDSIVSPIHPMLFRHISRSLEVEKKPSVQRSV